jgi:hypothetical protein
MGKRSKRWSLVWRSLISAFAIEILVLLITGGPMLRSFFSHSAVDPNSASNNTLATIGIYFHLPSDAIAAPFGLFLFAPLIQILLMSVLIFAGLHWWKRVGH